MAAVRGGGNNDDGADKSAFRCLDAARYVVSAVVVVLIVAVAARATMVVLRPDSLSLSVPRSSVLVERYSSSAAAGTTGKDDFLIFQFTLQAQNPSGRASMYFYNIYAYLFDNTTTATESTSPDNDSLIYFIPDAMIVPEMDFTADTVISDNIIRDPSQITVSFFDRLNRGARIDNATMRVEGTLVSEIIRSGYNTTPQVRTYYCRNLIVGLNTADQASMSSQATTCTPY